MRKILIIPLLLLAACRGEEPVVPSSSQQVADPTEAGEITGFWLLNEGAMGTNKATLDYFDATTGRYHKNLFAAINPTVARELGDVGNDLQIHGQRLWAVINCSNLVEVMNAATGEHIGAVSIPNCRYAAFEGRYAYVSSYAGKVQMDPGARKGYVAKIDTATLQIVKEAEVGYQPEQMAVSRGKLYVANSGGYRAPNYDRTVSVIDLETFALKTTIDVAPNLHHVLVDPFGYVWVSSRNEPRIFVIDPSTDRVTNTIDIPAINMTLTGEMLYVYGESGFKTIDTRTQTPNGTFLSGTGIKTPYTVAVNPASGEIMVADAKDYFTPGTLHCYSPAGVHKWQVTTGDIPAHIAFTTRKVADLPSGGAAKGSPLVAEVLDFLPAPGQFVNERPKAEASDTQAAMNAKVLQALREGRQVSLGGWGGYMVVRLAESVVNKEGADFIIRGNAYEGFSEPGIVQVARDTNGNGRPDPEEWFELAGSAHSGDEPWLAEAKAAGCDVATLKDYEMTYLRPAADQRIPWSDNRGASGVVEQNIYHSQSYYPLWAGSSLTFKGVRLPQNGVLKNNIYVLLTFGWGYADNYGDGHFDIDNAIGAKLDKIDFIRIYSAGHQINGWMGECSTEITEITSAQASSRPSPLAHDDAKHEKHKLKPKLK